MLFFLTPQRVSRAGSWIASILTLLSLFAVDASGAEHGKPKLVLHLSIDQFRGDYLRRFEDLFLPATTETNANPQFGGFRYLMQNGAWFMDAHHDHYPLATGPGHAAQLTGAFPYKSGVVGNEWFDKATKKVVYGVSDASSSGLLINSRGVDRTRVGASPSRLAVSTVGDELIMATGGQSKVWAIGLKDRAAIYLAGHLPKAIWFDDYTGDWVSSLFYFPEGKVPAWLDTFNKPTEGKQRLADQFGRSAWSSANAPGSERLWSKRRSFSRGFQSYKAMTYSPYGNDMVLALAQELVTKEGLGKNTNNVPDFLAINFSSNDYVGHAFGPDSPEALDILVKTDRALSMFFNWLNGTVELKEVVIVLTGDHGVAPMPQQMKAEARFDASTPNETNLVEILDRHLSTVFELNPPVKGLCELVEFHLYVNYEKFQKPDLDRGTINEIIASFVRTNAAFGLIDAFTREQITNGALPRNDVGQRVSRSYYPPFSGDIVMVNKPYWFYVSPTFNMPASHGTPYAYDTYVPLIFCGKGINKGRFTKRVSTVDIAPTLSHILGILMPSGSEGRILSPAVDSR